jgi:hypothetical protein
MNAPPVIGIVRQVGVWLVLLLGTVLVTLLFSVLGTISASVLAALALGACRRWHWQALPVSLTFPLVGLAMAQAAKADLEPHQRLSLGAAYWGAFWITYLVTLFVLSLEKRGEGDSSARSSGLRGATEPAEAAVGGDGRAVANACAERTIVAPGVVRPMRWDDLKGTWLCETKGPNGSASKRLLDIGEGRVVIRRLNADGSLSLVAEGGLELIGGAEAGTLKLSPASSV